MIARACRAGWVFLSAAAIAGVVVAHAVAYALVLPDPHERSEHLQATGHGYWMVAVYLAVAIGAAAVVWAVARGARLGSTGALDPGRLGLNRNRFDLSQFWGLSARQVLVFAVVEVVERLVAGAPVVGLWHEPAFTVGLAVQVVVAAGLTVLLRKAEILGARVAAAWRRRPALVRSPQGSCSPCCEGRPRQLRFAPARSRAPPLAAAAS